MHPSEAEKIPQPKETLADYLKRLRLSLDISQSELAERAGIHLQSLGKLERGQRQRLQEATLKGLALALDVPVEYLEAVSRGRSIEVGEVKRFCPHCWIPGTPLDLTWMLHRAKYCLICSKELRKACARCGEPFASFHHKFCPNCGASYRGER